jgi:hypothetical protein
MNPFQVLINWLRGIPSIPDITPTVLVTAFIYQSQTEPVLPPAGSGEPNLNSPLYVFSGQASPAYFEAGVQGLSITAYLTASPGPDAGFGAIICTTGIQWDGAELERAKSVEFPGLTFTYAPDWPGPVIPSLSQVEVVGDVAISSSEGQVIWLEFQTNVAYSDGEDLFPYWCVFYLSQSGHYRGPVIPIVGRPPEILHG